MTLSSFFFSVYLLSVVDVRNAQTCRKFWCEFIWAKLEWGARLQMFQRISVLRFLLLIWNQWDDVKMITWSFAENKARIGLQSCKDYVLSRTLERQVPKEALQRCVNLDAKKQWAGLAWGKGETFTEEVKCLGGDHSPRPTHVGIHDQITMRLLSTDASFCPHCVPSLSRCVCSVRLF